MDFDEVINLRRTARVFTGKKVSKEQIDKIIKSASIAPSARNRQPWNFYWLTDTQKEHITGMLFDWDRENPKEKTSVKGSAQQIESADKMIMVYKDSYKSKYKKLNYSKPDYLSLGCAIENMSLQAVDLGLGSCIVCDTLYIEEKINEYLNIKGYEQICGFIIGYPIFDTPPRQKKDVKELML